jgi:plastocyanin
VTIMMKWVTVLLLVILLVGCTPEVKKVDVKITPVVINVEDQRVGSSGSVGGVSGFIDRPGYAVVYLVEDGAFSDVIGISDRLEGAFSDVSVPVSGTPTNELFVVLHYDIDGNNQFSFPGVDIPVIVDDAIINKKIRVKPGETSLTIEGQTANGVVRLQEVVLDQDGYIAIHEVSDDGTMGPAIAKSDFLEFGRYSDLSIALPADWKGTDLEAVVHVEKTNDRELSVDDTPAMDGDLPIMEVFSARAGSDIVVNDQNVINTMMVDSAYLSEPGYVVAQVLTSSGRAASIIGTSELLESGLHEDFKIVVDRDWVGKELIVSLYLERSGDEAYDSEDLLATIDGKSVQVPIKARTTKSQTVGVQQVVRVDIETSTFIPSVLNVQKGTIVEWKNKDGFAHTLLSTEGPVPFQSQRLVFGQIYQFKFSKPGKYRYICDNCPVTKGIINVIE